MKHWAVWLAAPALVCLGGCGRKDAAEAKGDPPRAVTVAVAKAKHEDLSRELVLTAEFRPFQEIDVHAKVAGFVKKIYVDVGDRVKEGQLLTVLEIPEMQDDLTRALAAKRRSSAELERARDELLRSQSAHEASHLSYARLAEVIKKRPNLVAQQEIDDALARDRVSEAQVGATREALAAAEQGVQVATADEEKIKTMAAYARITAPFAGVISKRYADTGAMIQAGTASQTQAMPVVRLAEDHLLRLVLPVPESVVPRVRVGTKVAVRVPSLNRTFEGKVARFTSQVQLSTRTMDTEVDVPNPELVLKPGMYAEASLVLEQRDDALAIPIQAVNLGDQKKSTVFLVTPDKQIEERPVKLGIETPTKVEVLSGIAENDLVVVSGRGGVRVGERVEPKIVDLAALKGGE
ncbi:MAG TPA: efflux RND transporter periplasmic adaptor subunit [Bryobacteraceae bacterium]|nr:efflux RND transporter periplasmic adaptor subunit [Bryobacteraceae bacterium]